MPLSVVVLPAPFAPIKQTNSPCSTPRSMPLTAWMPPYATCRRLNSSSARADTRSSLQLERDLAAEIGGDDLGVILHFRRRPLRDLAAVVEHQHAIAHAHHQLHIVLDQQDGDSVAADFLEQPLQPLRLRGVH